MARRSDYQIQKWSGSSDDTATWLYRLIFDESQISRQGSRVSRGDPAYGVTDILSIPEQLVPRTSSALSNVVNRLLADWTNLTSREIQESGSSTSKVSRWENKLDKRLKLLQLTGPAEDNKATSPAADPYIKVQSTKVYGPEDISFSHVSYTRREESASGSRQGGSEADNEAEKKNTPRYREPYVEHYEEDEYPRSRATWSSPKEDGENPVGSTKKFAKVKMAKAFRPEDVSYASARHTPPPNRTSSSRQSDSRPIGGHKLHFSTGGGARLNNDIPDNLSDTQGAGFDHRRRAPYVVEDPEVDRKHYGVSLPRRSSRTPTQPANPTSMPPKFRRSKTFNPDDIRYEPVPRVPGRFAYEEDGDINDTATPPSAGQEDRYYR
jgi:hypothetical protein